MLDRFTKLFNPENPRKKAEMAFARLVSEVSLGSLPYRGGLSETRRRAKSQPTAIGVWLIPCNEPQTVQPDFTNAIPAVTFDLRNMGIGVLVRQHLECDVVVAIPDKQENWHSFECEVRHQSQRPGGWYQVGLQVQSIFEPSLTEMTLLRSHFTQELASATAEEAYCG